MSDTLQLNIFTSNILQFDEFIVTSENEREALSKAEEVRAAKKRIEENKVIDTNDLTLGVSYYKKLGLDFCKVNDSNMK